MGLLEYLRHFPDHQLDADGKVRKVWLFELRLHREPQMILIEMDRDVMSSCRRREPIARDEDEVGPVGALRVSGRLSDPL